MTEFEKRGIIERLLIEEWADEYFSDEYEINIEHTPADGFEVYDALITATHRTDAEAPTVLIIEAKIREKHYPALMLEEAKMIALNAKFAELQADCLIYLQGTPKGIYAFDLKELQPGFVWQDVELIKQTCDRSKGNKLKSVTYIDCNKAFHTVFTEREFEYQREREERRLRDEGLHLYKLIRERKQNENQAHVRDTGAG